MKRTISLVIALAFVTMAFAQTEARIKVVDAETKKPLEKVLVLDKEAQFGVFTNEVGEATLITNPEHIFVISFDGYISQELPVSAEMKIMLAKEEKSSKSEETSNKKETKDKKKKNKNNNF